MNAALGNGLLVLGSVALSAAMGSGGYLLFKKVKKPLLIENSKLEVVERLLDTDAAPHWANIGIKHYHGICAPVFSLKTEKSCGVGEFLDLIPLIDWCSLQGFNVVQVLPINDVSPEHNSPFSPISSFSLNPLLLSLSELPHVDAQTEEMLLIVSELRELNASERVQWNKVRELKTKWLRMYYEMPENEEVLSSEQFMYFVDKNKYWLSPYSLFRVFKSQYNGQAWERWPEFEFSDDSSIKNALEMHKKEVTFYQFLQFLCFLQMKRVKSHATLKNVLLKGDLPFLVSRDSADVWRHRELFHLHLTAGAPPDAFSASGQNWGMPPYCWRQMKRDKFQWWKKRLAVFGQFFDLYRIDHIVGFYRLWCIPEGKLATQGFYSPKRPSQWIRHGEKFLKMCLESSLMLPIGEDLGTVPEEVKDSMRNMGICGTKVIFWERCWKNKDKAFKKFSSYIPESMTTISTHDSHTIAQWWKQFPHEAQALCKMAGWEYTADFSKRLDILRESHHTPSLFHINLLSEYLALIPGFASKNQDHERINIPNEVSPNYWSYRTIPFLEQIAKDAELQILIQKILA